MTEAELQITLRALALAVNDLQTRLTRLEAFALSMNRRLQLQEAGTALYEIEAVDRRLN